MKMKEFAFGITTILLAGTIGVAASAQVVIVEQGVARVPVIVPENAPPATTQAADDLADYIEKISGARPDVIVGKPGPMPASAIWVGYQPHLDELFPEVEFIFKHPEEILLVSHGQHIAITGRNRMVEGTQTEHGTANAVYTFVQKHLGVRWLWPGSLGEDVVPQKTIALPAFEERFHPPFGQRRLRRRGYSGEKEQHTQDWYRLQRLHLSSFRMAAGHAFTEWWDMYHEGHPDYFALQPDGTRDAFPDPKHAKLCVSNPAVQEQWLKNAEVLLREEPARTTVSASPNDGSLLGECVCDGCRAWDHPDGPMVTLYGKGGQGQAVALTDRYIKFWNLLARGLRERFPDREVYVGAWAYGPYSTPPVAETLEHNVAIGFVGHFPISSVEKREQEKEIWQEWADKAPKLIFRPNLFHYSGGTIGLPAVAMQRTVKDFRFLAENSGLGLDVDIFPESWATQGPQLYLMAQLAYDPYQDASALMDDYYHRGFGDAADDVAAYFELMEEAHYAILERARLSSGAGKEAIEIYLDIYTDELLDKADAMLKTAEAKVADWRESADIPMDLLEQELATGSDADGRYKHRVAFVHTGFEHTRLLIQVMRAMKEVRESEGQATDAVQRAIALTDAREKLFEQEREGFAVNTGLFGWYYKARKMEDHMGPPSAEYLQAAGLEVEE